ncbi:DUF3168 domain-containing protein [Gemmobacter fulvus]|uniref:DUF3168 domain-containing protein n=1 Tax=Gemmobacter fulvus TaxID=2840474 RepID=A0A975S298_9RHOB|nr:DUF3168 domain-containing protein [Gemmobacter fulvus]MBT9244903.1 DUF3168 domain-containing protein [Gemmobacter fulvus]QWK90743.1 DUF3168 domain-containing protein [Gemmobacter fulvus]
MSYGVAAALQAAVYQRLVAQLPGVAVHDAVPPGGGAGTFVLIGPEEARDASDKSGGGAEHRFIVSVISDSSGFLAAKEIAVQISDALVDAVLTLSRGRLVGLAFQKARARRLEAGALRRIDLRFAARVED